MKHLPAFLAAGLLLAAAVPRSAAGDADSPPAPVCDPYQDYACLDRYLDRDGDTVYDRVANYYALEWGHAAAPSDPKAPPGRREGWPVTPETTPPMPFTEWPYGGTQNLGVTRPASADSPLMVGIANTWLGHAMAADNLQLYGWIDGGGNLSTSSTHQGGNSPAAYDYRPNALNFDQAVVYFERVPDTVQGDHVDWGFRVSAIYGENYRYTTAYGIASGQLLNHNNVNGYDFPMMYAELFIPQVAEGLSLRLGRFISLPDIEAQLAPNNYMYTHSISYTLDNYTNTGLQSTLGLTKRLFLQFGITVGTEAAPWHFEKNMQNPTQFVTIQNPDGSGPETIRNPLYPDASFKRDPGSQPSLTGCLRYQTQDGKNNVNACANAINKGTWGYNNLQWYGLTAYHKWNDHWHVAWEAYTEHQNNVPNLNNPTVQAVNAAYGADGGTPFSSLQGIRFNNPGEAQCSNPAVLKCTASSYGTVAYFNYSPDARNNFSIRPEFYWDKEGQRTGNRTRYADFGIGWQHWLSPQIELRPEITYYRAFNADAFNGDSNAGIAPNKRTQTVLAGDAIVHF